MAATIWHRAMVYLGLVDDDELDEPRYASRGDASMPRGPVRQYPNNNLALRGDSSPVGQAPGEAVVTQHTARPTSLRPIGGDDAPRISAVNPKSQAVRAVVPERATNVNIVIPERFKDAQKIADSVKASQPVIVNLLDVDRELSRRMIDFCSGVTYALGGSMDKVSEQVFLITPPNVEVSAAERMRLENRQYKY